MSKSVKLDSEATAAEAVSAANSQFDYDLHLALSKTAPNANFVYSSFSLSTALAMTKCGARNATNLELDNVCHFPKQEEFRSGYKGILAELKNVNQNDEDKNNKNGVILAAANALFVQHGFPIKLDFVSTMRNSFLMDNIQQVDFTKSVAAAAEINEWVEKLTQSKIKDIIQPDSLDKLTKIVLVNGVYFKGLWMYPFERSSTSTGKFQAIGAEGKKEVQAKMMRLEERLWHTTNDHARILELKYEGGQLAMLIFLPKEVDGLAKVQKEQVDHKSLFKKMSKSMIKLKLPAFRMESTHKLEAPLKQLGLAASFNKETADFTGIAVVRPPLYISDVVQKVFIEVNEEGTEAAAVTAGRMCGGGPPMVIKFNVDHPFMFQIIYKPRNLILFAGCVTDPTA